MATDRERTQMLRRIYRCAAIAGDTLLRRSIGAELRRHGVTISKSEMKRWIGLFVESNTQSRKAFMLHEKGIPAAEIALKLSVSVGQIEEWLENYRESIEEVDFD